MPLRSDGVARWVVVTVATLVGVAIGAHTLGLGRVERHHLESLWMWLIAALWLHAWLARPRSGGAAASGAMREPRPPMAWVSGAFVLIAFALYAPSLSVGLLSDDFVLTARAARGDVWSLEHGEFFRPAPLLLWRGVLAMSAAGDAPLRLHALNVLLHATNAVLVVLVATRLGRNRVWAVLAGLAFLTMPTSVEAVTWPSGVQDLLMTLGGLIFVVSAPAAPGAGITLCAMGGLMVALLAKETGVVVPFLAFVLWWREEAGNRSDVRRLLLCGLGVAGLYGLARLTLMAPPADYAVVPSRYVLKELLVRPFATLAVPWSDATRAVVPAAGLLSALWVLVVVTKTALDPKARRAFWTMNRLALWVVLSVLPVYAYLYVDGDLRGSRYLYLGSAGWSLLLVEATAAACGWVTPRGRTVATVGLIGLVVAWAGAARLHQQPWADAARLRDRVLSSARVEMAVASCPSATFERLPDAVVGAYVFRNGFREALAHTMGRPELADDPSEPVPTACRFQWSGSRFVVER